MSMHAVTPWEFWQMRGLSQFCGLSELGSPTKPVAAVQSLNIVTQSGAKSVAVKVIQTMLDLVEMARPKVVQDGMFLVGIDIVKDKRTEVNVFSPGGLGSCQAHTRVDFVEEVIRDLERKAQYRPKHVTSTRNVGAGDS